MINYKDWWQARVCDAFPNVIMARDQKATFAQFDFGPNHQPFMLSVSQDTCPSSGLCPDQTAVEFTRMIAEQFNRKKQEWLEMQLRCPTHGSNPCGCHTSSREKLQKLQKQQSNPFYAMFCPSSGGLVFVGIFEHCKTREPIFLAGTAPGFPTLLPGMCRLNPTPIEDPSSVQLRPGLCLFVSGCTGKSRGNTFVCLVKGEKLCIVMEPADLVAQPFLLSHDTNQ